MIQQKIYVTEKETSKSKVNFGSAGCVIDTVRAVFRSPERERHLIQEVSEKNIITKMYWYSIEKKRERES